MRDASNDEPWKDGQPPRAEPSLEHEKSIAEWEAFGLRCAQKKHYVSPTLAKSEPVAAVPETVAAAKPKKKRVTRK